MKPRNALGYLLVGGMVALLFAMMAATIGVVDAILICTAAALMTAIIIKGINLVYE